jgi:hypothetical protein
VIILVLLLHCFLLCGLLLFTLLSRKLDLDSIHAPHKSNFTLSRGHQMKFDVVKVLVVSFKTFLCKDFTILLSY